jgi:hypothetical protein
MGHSPLHQSRAQGSLITYLSVVTAVIHRHRCKVARGTSQGIIVSVTCPLVVGASVGGGYEYVWYLLALPREKLRDFLACYSYFIACSLDIRIKTIFREESNLT